MGLSWPSPLTGFGLQQNTNLAPASWTGVMATLTDDGTNKSVTLDAGAQRQFYRLMKQREGEGVSGFQADQASGLRNRAITLVPPLSLRYPSVIPPSYLSI